jgi:hypothetical protein
LQCRKTEKNYAGQRKKKKKKPWMLGILPMAEKLIVSRNLLYLSDSLSCLLLSPTL